MTALPWFTPTTIDGTPRRAFFERVPGAFPSGDRWFFSNKNPLTGPCVMVGPDRDKCYMPGYFPNEVAELLCRASVDRWARKQYDGKGSTRHDRIECVLWEDDDARACESAHRLADALGIAP